MADEVKEQVQDDDPDFDKDRMFRLMDGEVLHIAEDWALPMVEVRLAEWRAQPENEKPQHPDIDIEIEGAKGMRSAKQPAPKDSPEYRQYERDLRAWEGQELTQQIHLKFELAIGLTAEQQADVAESRAFGHNHSEHDGAFFVFDHVTFMPGESLANNTELSEVIAWIDRAPWGLKWGEGASLATFRKMFRCKSEAPANGAIRADSGGGAVSKRGKRAKAAATAQSE